MSKIIKLDEIEDSIKEIHEDIKKIVLVGGGFDILHAGHLNFLDLAKKAGDVLIILLESDINLRRKKGNKRPINDQKNRSIVLSSLKTVDYIIPLQGVTKDEDYDKLIVQIKPNLIALTYGDKNIPRRREQANLVGADLIIIDRVESPSTTELIKNGTMASNN